MEKNTVLEYVKERRDILLKLPVVDADMGVWIDGGLAELNNLQVWAVTSQPESPAPLSAEDDLLRYIQKLLPVAAKELEAIEYSEAFQTITLARLIQKVEEYTALSQRQPVAPEREEETDRKKAMKWWNVQHQSAKNFLTQEYYYNRIPGTLTGREIEVIWRKETSPSAENKGGEG